MPRQQRKPKSQKAKQNRAAAKTPAAAPEGDTSNPRYNTKPVPRRTDFTRKTTPRPPPASALNTAAACHRPEALIANPTIQALSSGGGNVSSTKELRMTMTDYFDTSGDSSAPYFSWAYDPTQTVFDSGSSVSSRTGSKVLGADLYALPRFTLDSAVSSALFVSSCPMVVTGTTGGTPDYLAGAARSTLLVPTSNQKWVKVGTWKAKNLFGDSTYAPAADESTGAQPCFGGVVLNPDTLEPLEGDSAGTLVSIQCKVVVHIAQALPQVVKLGYGVTNTSNANALNAPIDGLSVSAKDCLVQITGMSDTV